MAESIGDHLRRRWLERQRRRLEEEEREISREEIRLNLLEVELIERRREVARQAERLGVPLPVNFASGEAFSQAPPEPEPPAEATGPEGELERLRRELEARRAALPRREEALRRELAHLERIESELHQHWRRYQQRTADPDSPLARPRRRITLGGGWSMTQALLAVIAAVFVLDLLANNRLLLAGAKFGPAIWAGQWYRLVTSAFLHANLMHFATNAFSIYIIGPMVEGMVGGSRFLLIYLVSAVMGAGASLFFSPFSVSVGASGAIFGMLGYLLYAHWQRPQAVPVSVRQWVLGILLLNVFITFLVPRIDIWGHLGGLVGGFAAGFIAGPPGPSPIDLFRSGRPGALLLAALASVALGAFLWAAIHPQLRVLF
ncbi:MAG TPA: rhomboid family intramembrane serine protease [Limnochorda sp.]